MLLYLKIVLVLSFFAVRTGLAAASSWCVWGLLTAFLLSVDRRKGVPCVVKGSGQCCSSESL